MLYGHVTVFHVVACWLDLTVTLTRACSIATSSLFGIIHVHCFMSVWDSFLPTPCVGVVCSVGVMPDVQVCSPFQMCGLQLSCSVPLFGRGVPADGGDIT